MDDRDHDDVLEPHGLLALLRIAGRAFVRMLADLRHPSRMAIRDGYSARDTWMMAKLIVTGHVHCRRCGRDLNLEEIAQLVGEGGHDHSAVPPPEPGPWVRRMI